MDPVTTVTVNSAVDVSTTVQRLQPRRKLRGRATRRDPGGGGVNVARAITALGGKAHALVTAGGSVGRELRERLAQQGIRHTLIPTSGQTRENFTAYETVSGHEYRFVMPGPTLGDDEWGNLLEAASAAQTEFLVLSGSLPRGVPEDFYARIIERVKRQGTKVVLDTSGGALRAGLDEGVFLAKPNLRELTQVAGAALETTAARVEAVQRLLADGCCQAVALTLGDQGALFIWGDDVTHVAVPEVRTRSSVGAGDSFLAGLVLRLAQGMDRHEALRFAVAAGAAALLTGGTTLCCREDAERLYAAMS